jgi:hypothetical protein
MSVTIVHAFRPIARISPAVASSVSRVRPVRMTSAPTSANAKADLTLASRRDGGSDRRQTILTLASGRRRGRFSTCWCNGGAAPGRPRNLCANCSRSRASRLRRSSPIGCAPTERRRRNSAYRFDMSKACSRTTGPRIRICQCDDASGRCNVSNRPDRRNSSYPFTPSSTTRSTFNAILFPATRSALSEAKRFRIGGRRLRPEQEPSPTDFVRPKPSSRDSTAGLQILRSAIDFGG